MKLPLDHLVVAARSLEEGAAWIRTRLGVEPGPGGKHATMATHNRLMSLGGGAYLEVIAVDPQAPAPTRPRWFGLDEAPTQALLRMGPALIHWVVRSDDLERDVTRQDEPLEIIAFSRGAYKWRMALRADGALPAMGARPTMIQWEGAHPSSALPASGCTLLDLGGPRIGSEALIDTPSGQRSLPWTLRAQEE